ncbi:TRAP-type C4-dicarboxylate transport system permease small subunit [Azospirillum agricola]|uniref:TRAP transporter small permease n=1 Tax=Azospirillum agricola TaxID=1720247 RepID=UPI001AE2F910|nr:TRAP transporter small permease [Azospirillum agricola]MBP2231138.1 TRAP-type C4-dicarboxylate transport system permease small subunit [Azospirillum agricola]
MTEDTQPTPGEEPSPRVPIRIEEALAAAAIAAMGLITFANVLTRYLTNISLAFTEEYAIVLMVVMTLLGTSVAVVRNHHIRITYFMDRLSPAMRRKAELFALVVTMLVFLGLAGFGSLLVWDEYRFEETSPGLGVPQWIYTIWLPVLSAVIVARAAGRFLRVMRGRES